MVLLRMEVAAVTALVQWNMTKMYRDLLTAEAGDSHVVIPVQIRCHSLECRCSFYPRDAMLVRVIGVCLSVRLVHPSRAGIVSKRR